MQLGTRWAAGAEPPASVPQELRAAIAVAEAHAADPDARWTLTWLEGRPIAELDAGWEVLVDQAGTVITRPFDDED